MSSAVPPASNPPRNTSVVPYSTDRYTGASPPMWWSDSDTSHRSSDSTPNRNPEATAELYTLPAVSGTGLGSPVVPEVNSTQTGSSNDHSGGSSDAGSTSWIPVTSALVGSSTEYTGTPSI